MEVPFVVDTWLNRRYWPACKPFLKHGHMSSAFEIRGDSDVRPKDLFGHWRRDGPIGWSWRIIHVWRQEGKLYRPMYMVDNKVWRPAMFAVSTAYVAVRSGPETVRFAFVDLKGRVLESESVAGSYSWKFDVAAYVHQHMRWAEGDEPLLTYI